MMGCLDKGEDVTETSAEEPSSEPSSEPSTSEPSTSEPNTSEPGTSEEDCGDLDQQECFDCTIEAYPAGAEAYNNYLFEHCVCANECEETCADTCADPTNFTQECSDCVNEVGQDQDSACIQGFGAACQADSDCMDFYMATQDCF
jgi:hypothetical protein